MNLQKLAFSACALSLPLAVLTVFTVQSLQGSSGDIEPGKDTVFTSTRQVAAMKIGPDEDIWAATNGGVLWRDRDRVWHKITRMDGIPSHEARKIETEQGSVCVTFPTSIARLEKGGWRLEAVSKNEGRSAVPRCEALWRGTRFVSTGGAFFAESRGKLAPVPLPDSRGSHVTALIPQLGSLLAAIYGDGMWEFNGTDWHRTAADGPADITTLAASSAAAWAGTRRGGVWEHRNGYWKQFVFPDEPYNHNAQSIFRFRDELFVSTLEDGLVVRSSKGWRLYRAPELSSDAPRQMVEFNRRLYVRHGNGRLDAWDGAVWEKDLTVSLGRKEVSALATDGERLFAAQWGGWSEFDGRTWTSHLDLPTLQGVPTTAILPAEDTLWIGTQGRGLAAHSRLTGSIEWHDARHGLTDDWITALTLVGETVFAGTFVGGLMKRSCGKWTASLVGENVTAIERNGDGGAFISTRSGLWYLDVGSAAKPIEPAFLDREIQCLMRGTRGLWVGARTGLFYVSDATLQVSTR